MSNVRPKKYKIHHLRFAIKKRNVQLAREALRLRPKIRTPEGARLLWSAVDYPEIAKMMILRGVDISLRNPTNNLSFLLYFAARAHNENYQQLATMVLDRNANVNFRDNLGNTALHLAVKNESLKLAEALVKKGLSVDIANVQEETAVSLAAQCSNAMQMLEIVVEQHPLDAQVRTKRVLNAMQRLICSEQQQVNAIQALLKLNVDFNEESECGLTPFCLATIRGQGDLIKLFIASGLDPNSIFRKGNTSLIRASFLDQCIVMHMLFNRDKNLRATDETGTTLLHIACRYIENVPLRVLQLLLHLGADVNTTNYEGETPFSLIKLGTLGNGRKLCIKNLAMLNMKGYQINDRNMEILRGDTRAREFYGRCISELQRMERTVVQNDLVFYDFFNKSTKELSRLTRTAEFVENYNDKKTLFPLYLKDLDYLFAMAEERRDLLRGVEETLKKTIGLALPSGSMEMIASFACSSTLKNLKPNFYLAVHARTDITER